MKKKTTHKRKAKAKVRGATIERRHLHDALVGTLRKQYGEGFAKGYANDTKLSAVLSSTGTHSLEEYLKHSKGGEHYIFSGSGLNISSNSTTVFSHTSEVFHPALSNLAKK
jgi:hypothetical protein